LIDLHFVPTPNGHKISIMLLETGLPHRVIPYRLLDGEHLTPAFREINPNGRLPAIVDHDPIGGGAPYPVFETGAILIYLAEKTGRFLPADPRRRHQAIQWLMWQMSGLGPMHGQAHHFIRYCPEPSDYAVARYMNEAHRLLRVMDARLAQADYLAEEYSIADIACWSWIRAARAIDIDIAQYPHLAAWHARVGARPAVIEGAHVPADNHQVQSGSRKMNLTDEQWSNMFGENMLAATPAPGRQGAAP